LVIQDEIDRRDARMFNLHLAESGLDVDQTLENFDWDAKVTFDRAAVKGLFSLAFLEKNENVIFMGEVGVGKTHLAQAIGHAAVRSGRKVLALRADRLFKNLLQARGDHSTEREMRRLIGVDVLIIDDFGLRQLGSDESRDMYEVMVERHRRSTTIITSNRDTSEWIALFEDAILANSALDRFAHSAHQITMEGESYRKRMSPMERLKSGKR
jgi:DNA replication protein DnaC